jgi:hypothetical protein
VLFLDNDVVPTEPLDEGNQASRGLLPLLGQRIGSSTVASFDVTLGGPFFEWDGAIPAGTDVVFFAEGHEYTISLDTDQEAALTLFWQAGGGIVRTEWGTGYNENNLALSPVTTPDSDHFEGANTWTGLPDPPTAYAAALTRLPGAFVLSHGMTHVVAKTAAETGDVDVVTLLSIAFDPDDDPETNNTIDVPGLAVWPATAAHGAIASVNHDLLYDTESLQEAEAAPLFQAAVYAAALGN